MSNITFSLLLVFLNANNYSIFTDAAITRQKHEEEKLVAIDANLKNWRNYQEQDPATLEVNLRHLEVEVEELTEQNSTMKENMTQLVEEDDEGDNNIRNNLTKNYTTVYNASKIGGILLGISATISMIASSLLIMIILRSAKGLSSPQNRIIFGMSISDILYSSSNATFNSMIPKDVNYMVWNAQGNVTTCIMMGYICWLGTTTSLLYPCSLNLYYLLLVKDTRTNWYIRMKKNIEPYLHAVPILVGTVGSTFFLLTNKFNVIEGGEVCIYPSYNPPHCKDYENGQIPDGFDIPCGRGDDGVVLYYNILFFTITCVPPTVILTTFSILYKAVSNLEDKMMSYGSCKVRTTIVENNKSSNDEEEGKPRNILSRTISAIRSSVINISGRRNDNDEEQEEGNTNINTNSNNIHDRKEKSRLVLKKAMSYVVSYFLAWGLGIIGAVLYLSGINLPQGYWYITNVLNPAQGLFTFLVYMHFRILKMKNEPQNEDFSWGSLFVTVIASSGK